MPPLRRVEAAVVAAFQALAVVLATFVAVNLVRSISRPARSVAFLLFDVPRVPRGPDLCLVLLAGLALWSGLGPVRRRAVAWALAGGLLGVAALAGWNALQFYRLLAGGHFESAWPLPLSATVAAYPALHAALCLRARHMAARSAPTRSATAPAAVRLGATGAALAAALGAVLFHIHAFGLTDYRRPADAIVVLGARAYPNGTPSEALRERVETGVALYRAGLGTRLILSGGVDESGVSEPAVMRAIALQQGVPASAIVEDPLGTNTEASLRNVEALAKAQRLRSVLAVSHYFHLPRIKLLAERRGLRCYTVPADEGTTRLRGTPFYVLREAAALTFYFAIG